MALNLSLEIEELTYQNLQKLLEIETHNYDESKEYRIKTFKYNADPED